MSLYMNTLKVGDQGPTGAKTEQRPRRLLQPDAKHDDKQKTLKADTKLAAHSSERKPYTKPHGDTQPQEPGYHRTWCLDKKHPHLVQHPHPKPWSNSSCPGKRESKEGLNHFHRVWLQDTPAERGRWNKQRKKDFYTTQDKELYEKIPHDQKFCKSDSNYKFWTHLKNGGLQAGGQEEKLDYTYKGPNTSSAHFYVGKFDNVRHVQRIVQTGFKDRITGKSRELHADKRTMFDNRLHDDMIKTNDEELKWAKQSSFDQFRPAHTMSCPQLGADFVK
eukprot:TRINITY_DN3126_c0_g4_i1.p1 TRINITY_DN3126_c0_g4~~TRINITY_DN3126_c0_g4_i1.p1  ORF type:complete len:276 (-),score=34.77 TRINITY_DN3126_c0_g4_i1:549-1376(-)